MTYAEEFKRRMQMVILRDVMKMLTIEQLVELERSARILAGDEDAESRYQKTMAYLKTDYIKEMEEQRVKSEAEAKKLREELKPCLENLNSLELLTLKQIIEEFENDRYSYNHHTTREYIAIALYHLKKISKK